MLPQRIHGDPFGGKSLLFAGMREQIASYRFATLGLSRACSLSEFHPDAHEKPGLRRIVGEAVLFVVHEEVAIAHLCKEIAREIDPD
jgi:hypothetical protein